MMFKTYLITSLRALAKNKLISIINIMGLSVGLSCALLVFLFVQYEVDVDQFHQKIDSIYRLIVVGESKDIGQALEYRSDIDYRAAPRLLQAYPEITNVACLMPQWGKIDYQNQQIRENRFWFADSHIFNLLTLPLKRGNPDIALQAPNSVLITPEMAAKYFGEEDPVGKTFKMVLFWYPVSYTFTVTGILEPLPETSSIKIDFLAHVPFERLRQDIKTVSGEGDPSCDVIIFAELAHRSALETLQEKLKELDVREFYKSLNLKNMRYRLEPFKHAYLTSKATYYEADASPNLINTSFRSGDMRSIILLVLMGGIILIVSCINIINLGTAQATLRAREIGVRKVVGARRRQLILQFISETILLSCLSLLFALVFTELLLPSFNTLVQRELSVNYLNNWIFLLGMVGITVLTGFLSGIYPAFVLSAFKPVTALKSRRLGSSAFIRKGLMMMQTCVCVAVLLFALVMRAEISALKTRTVGFNSHNLIFFQIEDEHLFERYPSLKKEVLRIPGVMNLTASNFVPWQYGFMIYFAYYNQDVAVRSQTLSIDTSFMDTYQIPLTAGEGFRTEWVENEGKIIINETARKLLQSSGTDPLSRSIGISNASFWRNRVQGIMRDFYCLYPAKRIQPLVLISTRFLRMGREYVTIRLAENNQGAILAAIEKTVKRFFPKTPFDYTYVDKAMEELHRRKMGYRMWALVFTTGFSLFIAGVGLFGFAAYETERCTKEIGIRKTLGASPLQIAVHFILRFAKLTLMANLLAWPVCYFIIQWILRLIDYPHPVRIGFTHFLWAGLLTLALTIVVVWAQTLRAASIDPVKALRYE